MKPILRSSLFSSCLFLAACGGTTEAGGKPTDSPAPANQPAAPIGKAPEGTTVPTAPVPAAPPAPAGTPALADLGKLLGGITDGPTAQAAKGQLDALVASLKAAQAKAATAAGAAPAGGGLGDLGKLAGDALTKVGVSPETVKQIATLLENPAVKAAIGPTLQQLQSLVK